jgi:hypothetical protein
MELGVVWLVGATEAGEDPPPPPHPMDRDTQSTTKHYPNRRRLLYEVLNFIATFSSVAIRCFFIGLF